MALLRKRTGISADKWKATAEGLKCAEYNGLGPIMARKPTLKAFMF